MSAPAVSLDLMTRMFLSDLFREQSLQLVGLFDKVTTRLDSIISLLEKEKSYAPKTGTIEIVGEVDGVPAEIVGEYTTQ